MAYTTINKSTDYFNTKLYTGNSSTQALTGVGFQPDWVWLKDRSATSSHRLYDALRGVTKRIQSNTTAAEATEADGLTAFGTDGFTLGSNAATNNNGTTYVSWNWKANGAGSANNDGSIATTVSANTTAGFSIVTYTGTGNAGATIGHGLGAVPKWIVIKKRAGGSNRSWAVYHSANTTAPETEILYLNNTDATADSSAYWNDTAPTSSIITLGAGNEVNEYNTHTYVAYCFAEKKGYSKFGSYTGNGNADGTFVYTGFKPAFVMCKRTDGGTQNWCIMDNKRGYNPDVQQLHPNNSNVESLGSGDTLDLLSNGFKMRVNDGDKNGSGETFIYMAFGQSLVGSNNIPCTAR
jgi:hypothetical protein